MQKCVQKIRDIYYKCLIIDFILNDLDTPGTYKKFYFSTNSKLFRCENLQSNLIYDKTGRWLDQVDFWFEHTVSEKSIGNLAF